MSNLLFDINTSKITSKTDPIITTSYRILLQDEELSILFTGRNKDDGFVIGSSVCKDCKIGVERFFHIVVGSEDFCGFLERELTYLTLMGKADQIFVLDKYMDGRVITYECSLLDIPPDFIPSGHSYCPKERDRSVGSD